MMKLKIYNTLTRSLQEVEPIDGDTIRMYSCGLTVYDYPHIGNLRKYIFDDLLKRTLTLLGYKVRHVMNITDVGHLTGDEDMGEDKIEKGALREGKSAFEIAKFYENQFRKDFEELNIATPKETPRATEYIQEQIEFVRILEEKGFTYRIDDGIYFDTSKLSDYGKLAGLDIENLREGARVEKNEQKKNSTDFALWKFSYPEGRSFDSAQDDANRQRQMEWESPWGVGFPGWHLECSVMSTKLLGQPFEIHTGGVDHINVHHTNEIAQSEAAYGKELAKYWVHSEFLLENGHKMAKSAGHFIRLSDLKEEGFSPLDFRYLCLSGHYRSKLDFSYRSLEGASNSRKRLKEFYSMTQEIEPSEEEKVFYENSLNDFKNALANDLDTPAALAIIFNTLNTANKNKYYSEAGRLFFVEIDKVLSLDLVVKLILTGNTLHEKSVDEQIVEWSNKRYEARQQKDFTASDTLRDKIVENGYKVEDKEDYSIIVK